MKTSKLLSYCENNTDDSDFEEYVPHLKISKKKSNKKRKESSEDTDPSYINTDEFDIEIPKKKSKAISIPSQKVKTNENKSKKVNNKKSKNDSYSNNENKPISVKNFDTVSHETNENNIDQNIVNKIENVVDKPLNTTISCDNTKDLLRGIPLIKTSIAKESGHEDKSPIKSQANPTLNQKVSIIQSKYITTNLRIGLSRKQPIYKSLHPKF